MGNGRSPLWPVLNPRSHVSTQRVIAVSPTPAQIEEYRKRCEAQAKLWIESKALELTGQITALKSKILNRISCWHSSAKAYVMRVKSQFDCCVANKNSKTCTYTSNLKAKIAAQKLQLQ